MTSEPILGELAAEFTDLHLIDVNIKAERCHQPGIFSLIIEEREFGALPHTAHKMRLNLSVTDLTQILMHLQAEEWKGLPIACDPEDVKK